MIDKKDKLILYELSKNARIPINQLAKKIKLSQSSTKSRLDKLFSEEIIISTHPIIDIYKLGYMGIRIYFNFIGTTPDNEKEILSWLIKSKMIGVVGETTGNYNIVLHSWVKNLLEFHVFLKEFKQKFQSKITDLEYSTYVGTHFFSRDYLCDKKDNFYIYANGEKREMIDKLDSEILLSITDNSRKNIVDIANELNRPVRTINHRLKQLVKKKIVLGFGANINTEKIGYEYYKIGFILSNNIEYDRLLSYAKNNPYAVYVDETIGKYDYELNIEVSSTDKLHEIVNDVKEITCGFKKTEIFKVKKFHKLTYNEILESN